MHIVSASSALAALLFIKLNKIPMDDLQNLDGFAILFFYINAALAGPGAPPNQNSSDPDIPRFGFLFGECLSHVFGLGLVVFLLHIISPKLAQCVGIPSFVCLIASSFICLYASKEDLRLNENRL
ncbi:unnamed protein product [Microthlaspi erraticum]|uniref:Uncharacterized protein n=1 Tax=Microthlaspi erraticum TaxID=1685480 RepID=A0A6D2K479_9BRAS|nr:unnamed protein product [Microthlaspi erraticum]